ncbi:hypothetical protein UK23_11475 [Lentzea aerocolonigenes]|uniref:Uncharacterized protein n=1 Tax=Lentzea aerocolonigenes TaxID=68170 RepID=A0A0F0H9G8_LENAE|nr:hypothetical protein [Lentzea aerocolonigenes]KJK50278.1 hypothetical protein UK23_11475 [Lentzea aerocolonigenes]
MLLSLLVACVVFAIVVSGCAARVALSNADKQRRADGVKVLKLVWGTTGIAGLIVVAVKLHESGVI